MYSKGVITFLICSLILDVGQCFNVKRNVTSRQKRILGGKFANMNEASYHVQLISPYDHFCGGSLITKQHVLTAGHCIEAAIERLQVAVVVGSNQLRYGLDKSSIANLIIHPNYINYIYGDDIGIITLTKPFEGEQIRTVSLPKRPANIGTVVTVYGFGSNGFQNSSPYLKKFSSIIIPCMEKSDICVQGYLGNGVCFGDSGSGLINSNGEIVGIVSRGMGCGKGYYDVYTNVYKYLDFIYEQIGDESEILNIII